MSTHTRDMFGREQEPPGPRRSPLERVELASLQRIRNRDQRFFLRMYLRSNMPIDQEEAQRRCAAHGIDYPTAYKEARLT